MNASHELVLCDGLLHNKLLPNGLVDLGKPLNHFLPLLRTLLRQGCGDLAPLDYLALLALERRGLHCDEIYDALQLVLEANGHLSGMSGTCQGHVRDMVGTY